MMRRSSISMSVPDKSVIRGAVLSRSLTSGNASRVDFTDDLLAPAVFDPVGASGLVSIRGPPR